MTNNDSTSSDAFEFVPPDAITDPVAENLSWRFSEFAGKSGGANFRRFRLHQVSDRRLELRRTLPSYFVVAFILVVGIILLGVSIWAVSSALWGAAALAGPLALLMLFFGRQQLQENQRMIAFDRASGISGAVPEDETQPIEAVAMAEVRALQVLEPQYTGASTSAGSRDWFEVYLVLADGRRAFLFSNGGDYKKIFRDMEVLSAFLGVPVWGYYPKFTASARSFFRGLKWLFIVFFLTPIVLFMLNFGSDDLEVTSSSDAVPAEAAVVASPAQVDELFGGTYTTDFGELRLRALAQPGDVTRFSVAGRYDATNGIVEGNAHFDENEGLASVIGVWFQKRSDRKCSEQKYGSHYWGTFRWQMQAGSGAVTESNLSDVRFEGFTGRWVYCDDNLEEQSIGGSWNGKRLHGALLMEYCEIPEISDVHGRGC